MLVTCSESINIYDMANSPSKELPPLYSASQHKSYCSYATFNHNCKILASGGDDGIIKFHNHLLQCIQPIMDDDILNSPITSIHFSKDSKNMAYATKNGFYKIYNLASLDFVLKGKLINEYASSIQFNNENSKVTIGTNKGNIYSYLSPSFQSIHFKIQLNTSITSFKYSPLLPDTLGICTEDGTVKILDMINGELKSNFTGYHLGAVTGIAFSPVSKIFFASCGLDGKINCFDINEKKLVKTLNINTPLTAIAFNTEGNHIICGDTKGIVYLYDLKNSDRVKTVMTGNKGRIYYLEVVKGNAMMKTANKGLMNESVLSEESSKALNVNVNTISKHQNEAKRQPLFDKTNLHNTFTQEMNSSFTKSKGNLSMNQDINNKRDISFVNKAKSGLDLNDSNQMIIDDHISIQAKNTKDPPKQYTYTHQPLLQQQQQPISSVPQYNLNNPICEIDHHTQQYIKHCVENEYNKVKGFIHEELSTLHLDLLRQFEMQKIGIIRSLKALSSINNQKGEEIERLRKENDNLKSQFF